MTTIEKITRALQPETTLEKQLLTQPEFQKGLLWGKPRRGHPEGAIYIHIKDVLANINKLDIDNHTRENLRIIAFVHDTFKHIEDRRQPRDWSKHHSILARQFMENWIQDPVLLDIIELHDEVYHIWRFFHLYNRPEKGQHRKEIFLKRIGNNLNLYHLFFKCDTETGDKDLRPLLWFEDWKECENVRM